MDSDVNLGTSCQEKISAVLSIGRDDQMEVESQVSAIKVGREVQHVVKIEFQQDLIDISGQITKIKHLIYNQIKGNCLQVVVNKEKKSISFWLESEEEAKRFCQLKLNEFSIDAEPKMITNNPDLDSRKIRLSRPATGKISALELQESIGRFGEIEEFYECSNRNGRKRSFVVAFKSMEDKRQLLFHETVFIGKNLMKVSDYLSTQDKSKDFIKGPPSLRVSNFSSGINEYVVRTLMKNMGASFWHMPIAKNGYKMKCIIASFDSIEKRNLVMQQKWNFDGKILILSDVLEQVCLCCGEKDHIVSQCPYKPKKLTNKSDLKYASKNITKSWSEMGTKLIDKYVDSKNLEEFSTQCIKSIEERANNQELAIKEIIREQESTKQRLQNLEEDNKQVKIAIDSTKVEMKDLTKAINANLEERLKIQGEQIVNLRGQILTVNDGIQLLLNRTEESGSKMKKTRNPSKCDDPY